MSTEPKISREEAQRIVDAENARLERQREYHRRYNETHKEQQKAAHQAYNERRKALLAEAKRLLEEESK